MLYTWYQVRQREQGVAMSERKTILLRLDPVLYDALTGWGADELRSTNAQIEFLLRRAAARASSSLAAYQRITVMRMRPSHPLGR
jgi:hypothetical protein